MTLATIRRTCRAPGCTRPLTYHAKGGFCGEHTHLTHAPTCPCPPCAAERRKARARPDVETVMVANHTTNAGQVGRVPVSLPKAPFEWRDA